MLVITEMTYETRIRITIPTRMSIQLSDPETKLILRSDGSYYYSNLNGSTYYNDGQGSSVYTSPGGLRYYSGYGEGSRQDSKK